MKYTMRTIGELSKEVLAELLMQYDAYIIEFFDDGRHEEGMTPVCVHEFYENEFLGYAEEKGFSWKLYHVLLRYQYTKKFPDHLSIIVDGLIFEVRIPTDVWNDMDFEIRKHIEEYHGDTIYNIMVAESL